MNDLRIQLRLLTEARRDRLFALSRGEGVSPSDWLRGAIDRAGSCTELPDNSQDASSAPRNDESYRPTHDQHGWMKGPPRGR